MTFSEAYSLYGCSYIETSKGDDLITISRRIYSSDAEAFTRSLLAMNTRFDWNNIRPGSKIKYLPKSAVEKVKEIW